MKITNFKLIEKLTRPVYEGSEIQETAYLATVEFKSWLRKPTTVEVYRPFSSRSWRLTKNGEFAPSVVEDLFDSYQTLKLFTKNENTPIK